MKPVEPRLSYELGLLLRMAEPYRLAVLAEIRLTELEAKSVLRQHTFEFPEDAAASIDRLRSVLGMPAESARVILPSDSPFTGSVSFRFILSLWPHLFWAVNCKPDGVGWGPRFENQVGIRREAFNPRLVRPGVWTRTTLERFARDARVEDEWDEDASIRFRFEGDTFRGTFIYGLLQTWERVGEPTA